jgi:hypothetical protein
MLIRGKTFSCSASLEPLTALYINHCHYVPLTDGAESLNNIPSVTFPLQKTTKHTFLARQHLNVRMMYGVALAELFLPRIQRHTSPGEWLRDAIVRVNVYKHGALLRAQADDIQTS